MATRAHTAGWAQATAAERLALFDGVEALRQAVGGAVGVTHLRLRGDGAAVAGAEGHLSLEVEFAPSTVADGPAIGTAQVLGPGPEPLLAALSADLSSGCDVDLAVAFVHSSALELLRPSLLEGLARGARLRVLTGDYLDWNDPAALRLLLDLQAEAGDPRHVDLRVFETDMVVGFHPKLYLIRGRAVYVGSSNLTARGLEGRVEANLRYPVERDPQLARTVQAAYDHLFADCFTTPLTADWIDRYERRRARTLIERGQPVPQDMETAPLEPHEVQREALEALAATRDEGNRAALVVLATGLGKTVLAAFDSRAFRRVLFVAHRHEILVQARRAFRRARPEARLGSMAESPVPSPELEADAEVAFASVQALSRPGRLATISPDAFDYIIVDEFHHATAPTYRAVLAHFRPRFLLGMTATPDRSDNASLLALCAENLAYECGLHEGIQRRLLCPFAYHGVPDEVDYAQIPWRSGRFDPTELDARVVTEQRARNALSEWRRLTHGGVRTLAFCVSQRHADFMRAHCQAEGIPCASVHAGPTSDPRAGSLRRLASGDLHLLFCVDLFNEGVDVPEVDALLLLRPTASSTVWLQQLGRGLRARPGKTLQVIDFVGNHRCFLTPLALLAGVDRADSRSLAQAIERASRGALRLPPGCSVEYELRALDLLKAHLPRAAGQRALRAWGQAFQEEHGRRPLAVEAWRGPRTAFRALVRRPGAWLRLAAESHWLSGAEERVRASAESLWEGLHGLAPGSDAAGVLAAWVRRGGFPAPVGVEDLLAGLEDLAEGSTRMRFSLGAGGRNAASLRALLEGTAGVAALVSVCAPSSPVRLHWTGSTLRLDPAPPPEDHEVWRAMGAEVVDWLLAERLARGAQALRALTAPAYALTTNDSGEPVLAHVGGGAAARLSEGVHSLELHGRSLVMRVQGSVITSLHDPERGREVLLEALSPGVSGPGAQPHGPSAVTLAPRPCGGWAAELVGDHQWGPARLQGPAGQQVDATFLVEQRNGQLWVILESRGGTAGSKHARNTEYALGLELLLDRLALEGASIRDALLDTRSVAGAADRALRLHVPGRPFPIELDAEELSGPLARSLRRAQGSNPTRRMRLRIELPDHPLAVVLGPRLAGPAPP